MENKTQSQLIKVSNAESSNPVKHVTLRANAPPRRKRRVVRRTNKMANMTKEDWQEANEVSKRSKGISRLTFEDIFGKGDLGHQ